MSDKRIRVALGPLLRAVVALMLATTKAGACAICFSGMVVAPGQKLDAADQVALAVPAADNGRFKITDMVKGDAAVGALVALTKSTPLAKATEERPLLILHNQFGEQWSTLGPIGAGYAGWLRQLVASGHDGGHPARQSWPTTTQTWAQLSDAGWHDRVAVAAPRIEAPDPLVADIVYGELARAPYGALRAIKPQLDARKISAWVADPSLASRRSTYTLLLGVAGDSGDAERLESRLETASVAGDATNLAALIAADLELRGASRLGWVEANYFADHRRSFPEIQATLLALSVLGQADGKVSRAAVIDAYEVFIKERPLMAGLVAIDLADWNYWDATNEYVALLKSGSVQDPSLEFAIATYLQRSPREAAKVALQSLLQPSQ